MERRHVLREHFARVAFRIDRHEQHLEPRGVRGRQGFHHLRKIAQRGRTDVGTVGETEEDHRHLAAEILQRARLALMIGQREFAPDVGAGDVGELELRITAAAAGERESEAQRAQDGPEHDGQKNSAR